MNTLALGQKAGFVVVIAVSTTTLNSSLAWFRVLRQSHAATHHQRMRTSKAGKSICFYIQERDVLLIFYGSVFSFVVK